MAGFAHMPDRPILFSAPMVRSLLSGSKTQTRRLAWKETKAHGLPKEGWRLVTDGRGHGKLYRPTVWQMVEPGDRLWVRETHTTFMKEVTRPDGKYFDRVPTAMYATDYEGFEKPDRDWDWKPSIHMPRWASRLTLIVTETKRERLQDISPEDCMAEGRGIRGMTQNLATGDMEPSADYYFPFADLWDSIHGKNAWDENPEIVAISFRCILANIDALETEAGAHG